MSRGSVRLALDVAPVRADPAGVGVYAASLALALARRDPGALTLIGAREDAWALHEIPASVRRLPFRAPSFHVRVAPNYHAWLQLHADAQARQAGARLAHYTNAAAPLLTRVPFVLTVHDLSVLRLPHLHPFGRVATAPITIAAIARARAIVVPSNWVRRELTRIGVSGRRVVVIEHAKSEAMPEGDGSDEILPRFGLTKGNYVLTIGTIEPRKNIVRLIDAWEQVAAGQPGLRLVLAGAPGWRRSSIDARLEQSPLRDRIVVTGYLRHAEIGALIRSAAVMSYVSVYEGFGMPIVEAMALGAPVVTSDRTSMPQAAGGAAVLVNPFDVDDIARGIREAIARRDELAAAGMARVAKRTWADVAEEHWAVYERALTKS